MDQSARILIVEPDHEAQEALGLLLAEVDIDSVAANDGTSGLRRFYRDQPDMVVLALELPEVSGWEVLATIRELSDVPVLILAEGSDEADKVRALRAGADDFVAKPYGRSELQARVEALLRRPRAAKAAEMFADDFVQIDHLRHEVEALGAKITLTPTEFRMLTVFARHAGQVLTHAQLLDLVWGEGHRDQREVKLYVSYLRRKLRTAGVEPIETVRGIGYRYRPHRVDSSGAGRLERRRL